MNLYQKIKNKEEKISLIGLGYVGMPIAVAFSKKASVIGFDLNQEKVKLYQQGIDPTKEVGDEGIKACNVFFTTDETKLKEAKFHIVAVPTPINQDKTPDLTPIKSASTLLGRNLTKDSIVVYESTVFPGVTEEICIPILEKKSGLKAGIDFKVGYSPERINPGDKVHRLETIIKIVSGMDQESLETIAKVYELVVEAGVYKAESIKVAEAAKVIENSQRDINIAFMNELSMIFNKMDIDTQAVLKAAGTKWNFLNFIPGLVGGHCIGVDPYYLTYKAEQLGYRSQIILSGRRINDDMGKYVVENLVKQLIKADIPVKNAKVGILGFTFKEDCPDTRNTRVIDMVNELKEYGILPKIYDPIADQEEAKHEYGIHFTSKDDMKNFDAIILAVSHQCFKELKTEEIEELFKENQSSENRKNNNKKQEKSKKIIIDLKGMLQKEMYEKDDCIYWRL